MIQVMCTNDKRSLELKKHVGAIHSSNRLTLVQRKVANALLYNAYNNLLTQEKHSIHIKALCDLIGYDSKDYKTVKNALIALISTVIQWNLIDVDKDKGNTENNSIWNASSIIADASINGPICSYSYSLNMRQLLYHPEVYGRLNMSVQAKFKSTYGLALYENCIRYQRVKQTQWFDLVTFRSLMGVEKEEYPIFRDFKRRVLDKAITEVNIYSPIFIKVRFKKQGRAVVYLQFLIETNQGILNNEIERNLGANCPINLLERLQKDFGFSSISANKIVKAYDVEYILAKMAIVENSGSFKSGTIGNLAMYLKDALEKDYQPPKSSMERMRSVVKQELKDTEEQKYKERKLEEYRRFQNKEILRIYHNELPCKEKQVLEGFFVKYIKQTVYRDIYLREGLDNALVADKLCFFIKADKRTSFSKIISFEEFCTLEENNRIDSVG